MDPSQVKERKEEEKKNPASLSQKFWIIMSWKIVNSVCNTHTHIK
jgi:hypothetical protein